MIAQVQHGGAVEGAPPLLLPVFGADDQLSDDFERRIHPIVERAKAGDADARDALYHAFEPKIRRFVRRVYVPLAPDGTRSPWDHDDVAQEAYLVFLRMVERWPPATPFGRYFLANFPWRLHDAVYRSVARRGVPPRTVAVPVDGPGWTDGVADDSALDGQALALIEALAASLEPPLDGILRLHILDGLTLIESAGRLGISRRTITRHWRSVLEILRITEA